jgi:hypothetical protein
MNEEMFVGEGIAVESHYACVVYDENTGVVHHVHEVFNLVGAEAPSHDQMVEHARVNATEASGSAVLVVPTDQLQRGRPYRVDPVRQTLQIDEDPLRGEKRTQN